MELGPERTDDLDADGEAAADDLAVGRQIRPNADHGLHAARVNAKTGDDLVHDEGRTRCFGDLADFAQEIEGPQMRMTALHGFDDDGGKIIGVVANPLQRRRRAVFEHDHVLDLRGGNARCHRHGTRRGAG